MNEHLNEGSSVSAGAEKANLGSIQKKPQREVVKQRDGSILVIDYDQFNQLIRKTHYASDLDFKARTSGETINLGEQPEELVKDDLDVLIETINRQEDLDVIKNRQKLMQQEKLKHQHLHDTHRSVVLAQIKKHNDLTHHHKDSGDEIKKQFQQFIRETVLDEIQETKHEDEPDEEEQEEEDSLLGRDQMQDIEASQRVRQDLPSVLLESGVRVCGNNKVFTFE